MKELPAILTGSRVRERGLTLIELVIVVAVLAILATIAIAAYENLIRSSRRADGRTAAMAVAHAEERHFSVYQTYTNILADLVTLAGLDASLKVPDGDADYCAGKWCSPKRFYEIVVQVKGEIGCDRPFCVTLKPVAGKSQARDDNCTKLILYSDGSQLGEARDGKEVKCW